MLNQVFVVADKEITDAVRDVRSGLSSLFYALMGPSVVALVALGIRSSHKPAAAGSVLVAMISIFALVAPFTGGMNIAMDAIAGERERQSLVPLLLNPLRRIDVLLGKWVAVTVFSTGGLLVNLAGVIVLFAMIGMRLPLFSAVFWLSVAAAIFSLPLLAASLELLISTLCRSVKEAQTYLSLIVFLPMVIGMFLVFFEPARAAWVAFVPLAGQQL